MEKDHKIIIITEEIKKRKLIKKYDYCYKNNNLSQKIKNKISKAEEIVIYDITKTKDKEKKFHINDHINKTGKNPLINKEPLEFLDISRLYQKKTKGRITTGLGNRFSGESEKHALPSSFLCIVAILCKKINPSAQINAKTINCL